MTLLTGYEELRSYLIDLVREAQLKLGYSELPIRFFYPLDALNRMFGVEYTAEEMDAALQDFEAYSHDTLGGVTYTNDGTRFCFHVPKEGTKWVQEHTEADCFLAAFLEAISTHGSNIDTLKPVFERYSDCVIAQPMESEEFDWLVYFQDGVPDSYRYCIQHDLGHATYHRYTKKDYEAFGV